MATEEITVEEFRVVPSLMPIFARSAASTVLRRSHVVGQENVVPDTRLRLVEHEVDRGRLGDYQRVCGFSRSDRLPHTYPHVLGFGLQAEIMSRPGFPFPMVGLVHVENTITVHRQLTADDVLDITVHADTLRTHPNGRQVDLVTDVSVGGERVWEGRSTYLARGERHPEAERSTPPPLPTGRPAALWRLPAGLGRTYAGVSGDVNPIHMWGLTAKAMGFPKAIAHGMWTYARTLAALGARADGPASSHVWFLKPVLLPGSVELVVAKDGARVVAGLRHPRKRETQHLALTLD